MEWELYELVNGHESILIVCFFQNILSVLLIRLIINESINVGSQLDYIARARTNGYGVIVTNTNLNTDESSKSITNSSRPIRVS